MQTKRQREKRKEKRWRARYEALDSRARRGMPGAAERADVLDIKLKLLGIRRNV